MEQSSRGAAMPSPKRQDAKVEQKVDISAAVALASKAIIQGALLPKKLPVSAGNADPHANAHAALWAKHCVAYDKDVKVVAIQAGWYDHTRKKEGDVFTLRAGDRMGKWMKPI